MTEEAMNGSPAGFFEQSSIAFAILRVETDETGAPRDFAFVRINEAMAQLEGVAREKLMGRNYFELCPEADPKWLAWIFAAAHQQRKIDLMDYAPKAEKYLRVSFFPVEEEHCCGCIMQDMSPLTMQTKRSIEDTDICLFYYDMVTENVFLPAAARARYGLDKQYAGLQQAFSESNVTEKSAARLAKKVEAFRQGGMRLTAELQMQDNTWIKVSIARPEASAVGSIALGYIENVTEKVTNRQVIDGAINRVYERVVRIDGRSGAYTIYAEAADGAVIPARDGGSFDAAIREAVLRECYPQEAAKVVAGRSLDTVKKMLSERESYEFNWRVKTTGADRFKQCRYVYLNREDESILATCTDITETIEEERTTHQALEAALIAAKQASSAKSNFLSRMSHEIRTPMNAIIGMCTLAQQALGNEEEVGDCLSKIGLSGRYLLSLINDILDMSRIESGKMLLHNTGFMFSDLVNNINTVIVPQTNDKHIDYESIIDSQIDEGFVGDAMKLEQVMINLLGNAVKFTPEHGKIIFSASLANQDSKYARIRFAVNDTGCGIREDSQERIFEAFEQQDTSTTSEYGGTGLGLTITKNLVELMGGTIRVRSIVGVGTEFTVEIPLEKDAKVPFHMKESYSFVNQRALVVDDDVLVCEQAAKTLSEIGMISEWVSSGGEAIELVQTKWNKGEHFDYILVDWKMPDMDGIETARNIRRIVGPDVTIIIMTAYDWIAIEKEAKAAGVNMLISKPMFKSTLISAFEKAVGEVKDAAKEDDTEAIDFAGKRFLLAEDHPLNAEIVVKLLHKKHAEVDLAENGIKAMEAFATTPAGYYDAILMDIRMPVMDGLTATTNIRHWNKLDAKTIPIIAMTANAFEEDAEKSKLAGMNAHLAKPIDPDLMYRTLFRMLNRNEYGL